MILGLEIILELWWKWLLDVFGVWRIKKGIKMFEFGNLDSGFIIYKIFWI